LVAAVVADGRRRRVRRLAGAWALAAGVLAAAWLARPVASVPPRTIPGPPAVATGDARPGPTDLREGVAEAGSAFAALTRRAAAETVGQGRLLVPPVEALSPAFPVSFDPAARPLGGARQGLAEGLEPVTTSA